MGDGGRCDLFIHGQFRDRIASQKGIYVGRKVVLLLTKPDDEQINDRCQRLLVIVAL